MSAVTVVIPTFNRAGVLKKALDAYSVQSPSGLIRELIVVDDGSTDNTRSVVGEASKKCGFEVRYVRQPNSGPAAARNLGIREARAEIILFTDSDIVPDPELVSRHLLWHRENPADSVAVLGYVTWPQEPRPTPFMKWLGEDGALFAYREFRNRREISYRYMYTCNLSFKADFLRATGQFNEEFKVAAWEDIELGYRLSQAGLRLLYNPDAVAYHHQFFTFGDVRRKVQGNSAARIVFARTAAGKQFEKQQQERRTGLRYRLAKLAALAAGALARPADALLDSHVPLPASIYRALYWYHVNRLADAPEGRAKIASGVVMDAQK
jgi:glycosyltransferase involved in cell wall biosynthesis